MKGKKFLWIAILIILMWSFYGSLIRKISNLEKINLKFTREIRELEKEKNKRVYEYDLLIDLRKIENEMTTKYKMTSSEKINFFKLEKNSVDTAGE